MSHSANVVKTLQPLLKESYSSTPNKIEKVERFKALKKKLKKK